METNNYATIDGFEKLSAQEVFDMSARHLLTNPKVSVTADKRMCLYAGHGCAAAVFLRPEMREKIDADPRGTAWVQLVGRVAPANNSELICKLQNVHDSMRTSSCIPAELRVKWGKQLHGVAKLYNLNIDVIKELAP